MPSEIKPLQPERLHPIGLGLLFGLLYFIQGISEPTAGLLAQPVNSLLKSWGRNTQQIATFAALLSLPWSIKPIYGLLSDFFPLFGYHRKSYLIVTSAVASACLAALYAIFALQLSWVSALPLFLLLAPTTLAVAFSDVVIDALMVEKGQPHGWTGRFQSVQWGSIYAASILAGTLGGYLSQHSLQHWGFLLCSLMTFGALLLSVVVVSDRHVGNVRADSRATYHLLRQALASRTILAVGAFLFLWHFNPFSETVLYMYMTQGMKFSEQSFGNMNALSALGAMCGSFLYGFYCRKIPLAALFHVSIALGILSTLAYWGLRGETSAQAISVAVGFSTATAVLIQLDLAAQVCPPQAAGTLFALMMGLMNFGRSLSTWLGGWCYESWLQAWGNPLAFNALVGIGALFTAGCWLLAPLLKPVLPRTPAADALKS